MNWCEKVKQFFEDKNSRIELLEKRVFQKDNSRIEELETKVRKLEKEVLWKEDGNYFSSILRNIYYSDYSEKEDITLKQVVKLLADKLEVYPTTTESKVVLEERSKPKKSKKGNK